MKKKKKTGGGQHHNIKKITKKISKKTIEKIQKNIVKNSRQKKQKNYVLQILPRLGEFQQNRIKKYKKNIVKI